MASPPNSGRRSAAPHYIAAAETSFDDEIHTLIHPPTTVAADDSFTALLALSDNQALELLHRPSAVPGGEMWRIPHVPLDCSPTFPSKAALVDRAARYSVFAEAAGEDSAASSSGDGGQLLPKEEPPDCAGRTICSISESERRPQRGGKRKEAEKGDKVKGAAKKSRNSGENTGNGGDGEKLPYVHVRARRGQATDSHSLAERARREKINARMKLLQELVPGCSKISGMALVLDEIINHVQFLQRQVELLSMRLAAVNPRVDFSCLDNLLSTEYGREMACGNNPWPLSDFTMNGHEQICYVDSSLPFIPTATSIPTPPFACSPSKKPSLTTN